MVNSLRIRWLLIASFVIATLPVKAQVRFGDFSTDLNGTISGGYTGNYGNESVSAHDWTAGGSAQFTGFYYNPNFLSFNISPFYNQGNTNSNFQSISNATGVNASSSIFSGSNFPGSVYYSNTYNGEGTYGIPGLASYTTHGDTNNFGVNWSETIPDKPSFSAGYSMGDSSYSIYGLNNEGGSSSFRNFHLQTGYNLAGFNLGAYFNGGETQSTIPEEFSGGLEDEIHSDDTNYGLTVAHLLPLHGSFSANLQRSDVDTNYLGYTYNGTIDTINTVVAFQPTNKLSVSAGASYSDNLEGQLYQPLIAAGAAPAVESAAVVEGTDSNESSHALDVNGSATYTITQSLHATAFFDHRQQTFLGESFDVNSLGGGLSYARILWEGGFNASVTVTENGLGDSGTNHENYLGFSGSVNYSREILGWNTSGSFNYAQNMQTILVEYTTSYYNYSLNTHRKFGKFAVSFGGGAGRSGLTQVAGTESVTQTVNAGFGYGQLFTITGNYAKSSGEVVTTGAGYVPVPVPPPVLPSGLISLYGGESYGIGIGSSPRRGLILSASFSKSHSNTTSDILSYWNNNEQFNALLQYRFRKVLFTGGYSRLEQGFSNSGLPPAMINSFYVGVSRWFNFF